MKRRQECKIRKATQESSQDDKMKLEAVETAEAAFQKQPWQNKDSDDLQGACS